MPTTDYVYTYSAGDTLWNNWNEQYLYAGTPTTVNFYGTANVIYDCMATSTGSVVWTAWNEVYYGEAGRAMVAAAPTISVEEQLRNQQARQAREAIANEQRKQASERAEALMMACLTPAQRQVYREQGYIEINCDTRRYRIRKGWAGNITEVDANGASIAKYCIHPATKMPDEDNMLAQVLLLESDEQEFLRIANRTALR